MMRPQRRDAAVRPHLRLVVTPPGLPDVLVLCLAVRFFCIGGVVAHVLGVSPPCCGHSAVPLLPFVALALGAVAAGLSGRFSSFSFLICRHWIYVFSG